MKRFALVPFILLVATAQFSRAQDATPLPNNSAPAPNNAAAIAARQEAQENYNSLRAQIDDLTAAQADQRKQIQELRSQIQGLKSELNKPKADSVSADDFKQLAATVQKIDEKRQADKELILDQIKRLGKVVGAAPSTGGSSRAKDTTSSATPPPTPAANPNQEGYNYVVKKGDNLAIIAKLYRDKGVMVTKKMIIDANPKMNPDVLLVGEKIFIPEPK